jgi:heptosyltransferase-2
VGTRILIIKLAATGDVIRTTPLLSGLREKYKNPHITWVTDPAAFQLLRTNREIDRLFTFNLESVLYLTAQGFDLLISLDKEPRAVGLAGNIRAKKKAGFRLSKVGTLDIFDRRSEYALRLGIDDPLKFNENEKSYQEIVFGMCGLDYRGERYDLKIDPADGDYARSLFEEKGLSKGEITVGLNIGAGPVFVNKAWTEDGFLGLIERLGRVTVGGKKVKVVLLGGEDEREKVRRVHDASGKVAIDIGCGHSVSQFAAIVSRLDLLVTGDTMALHLALAFDVKVVAIFGPTVASEIDLFGLGRKVVTGIDCAPCYRSSCDRSPNCMDAISTGEVLDATLSLLAEKGEVRGGG